MAVSILVFAFQNIVVPYLPDASPIQNLGNINSKAVTSPYAGGKVVNESTV